MVGLSAQVPADAFTAEVLGTERGGNGVLIRDDGLVLTIGYLITEAEAVWLTTGAGYFWPQWSIVGWGLLLALHGWFAEGRHRGMLATETTQPDR